MAVLRQKDVFRDSQEWYKAIPAGPFSNGVIEFCRSKAGTKVLDLGCATGAYCIELNKHGFECTGADTNAEYVQLAAERGVKAVHITGKLPFADKAFDTVMMIEVLEHVEDVQGVLHEVKRVASKNVLLTVPCNDAFLFLRENALTYEHMLERDHLNFFTEASLKEELLKVFPACAVTPGDPIFPHRLLPTLARKPVSLLYGAGILKPRMFTRLYAECRTG
jgi:2-polyprenyl-3-methyl-5-hydroxy-6-metoxy-1,4-benzoquinol methylase